MSDRPDRLSTAERDARMALIRQRHAEADHVDAESADAGPLFQQSNQPTAGETRQ